MKNLKDISISELKWEIARREKEESKKKDAVPKPLNKPDFSHVQKTAKRIIEEIALGKESEDNGHWCYEAIMEAVYGKKVWLWINEKRAEKNFD